MRIPNAQFPQGDRPAFSSDDNAMSNYAAHFLGRSGMRSEPDVG